jgi:hypothetical protein
MKAHRILSTVGLALALGAVLAGGAHAAERPDDRAGLLGVGGAQVVVAPPDAFERAVLRQPTPSSDVFERAALRSTDAPPDVFERAVLRHTDAASVRPDDRAGVRGPGAVAPAAQVGASALDSGFPWSNALLVAGGILLVALLGIAATTIRHRGRVIVR